MSASTGTRWPTRLKSLRESGTPAALAMASRCSTALVEPSSAVTTVMAFSNASKQRMSDGLMPACTSRAAACPAENASRRFCSLTASCADEFGSDKPIASMAEAMLLAVYIPAQAPGPGMAVCSTASSSASLTVPAAWPPTASNTEMMSRRSTPVWMVPPYTKTPGRSRRANAIAHAGMFLSQPPMATTPSNPCAPTTVSMESAMTSRETSE